MEKKVSVSVREVVEFVIRSGDIDAGYISNQKMQQGIITHTQLQKQRKLEAKLAGIEYKTECPLKTSFNYKGFEFTIDGRADGIFIAPDFVKIEEIKSTSNDLGTIEMDENHWHFAQAKFYGYLYCILNNIDRIIICVTYCHVDSLLCKEFEKEFSLSELKEFFFHIIEKYYIWVEFDYRRKQARNESISHMPFPFENFRKGQEKLSKAIYKTILKNKKMFIQAPTGTGKTISALFPSVHAVGNNAAEKIFYVTAKTVTRQVAEDAFSRMGENGLLFLSVTLTAKDKICLGSGKCNPYDCKYAKGHFDRVNEAVFKIISEKREITRKIIEEYAEKYRVCPHEFQLEISVWCDAIIGDYNHVFDPKASLKRFFGGESKKSGFIFLVDEAHNLPDRARDMFSASLSKSDIMALSREFKGRYENLYKISNKLNKVFINKRKELLTENISGVRNKWHGKTDISHIYRLISELSEKADLWLAESSNPLQDLSYSTDDNPEYNQEETFQQALEAYFKVLDFMRIFELYDERYTTYIKQDRNDTTLKLFCLDPSFLLMEACKRADCSIMFSATLTPINYFREILGGEEGDYLAVLPSPFQRENLRLMIEPSISTKYNAREKSYEAIADRIFHFISQKQGNYFVFFSSYDYMITVRDIFINKYGDIKIISQERDMSDEKRAEYLEKFNDSEKFLAFAVMGGVFSEGIDLVGDKLIGAIIVGVGLPLITYERNIIKEYYEEQKGCGFDYAYVYPGMNKVLQAAGRVIRTEQDKGAVLLIDDRFITNKYLSLFPWEWGHYRIMGNRNNRDLEGFWE